MPTIKLTKVNIGPTRYIVYDSGTPTEVTSDVFMVVDMDGNVIYNYSEWNKQIGFSTLSKELSNKEYATQTNGYHWVKIEGYKMYKIPPEMITKDPVIDLVSQNATKRRWDISEFRKKPKHWREKKFERIL